MIDIDTFIAEEIFQFETQAELALKNSPGNETADSLPEYQIVTKGSRTRNTNRVGTTEKAYNRW